MGKRFVFVAGCPRSGTTALTTILNWADEAFIGQERFANLFLANPPTFLPSLFESKRFTSFQQGDCGYSTFEGNGDWGLPYAAAKDLERYDEHSVVGDKITELYRNFDRLAAPEWIANDVMVVQIIRKPQDVFASYERRRADPGDSWQRDIEAGIADWSASVEQAHKQKTQFRKSRFQLHMVMYEALFERGPEQMMIGVRKLYATLGLRFQQKQADGARLVYDNSLQRAKQRKTVSADLDRLVGEKVGESVLRKYTHLQDISLFV